MASEFNCVHCGERPDSAEGTVYCQPCLDWLREDWSAYHSGTARPTWDPFDPDDVAERYPQFPVKDDESDGE